MADSVHGHSPQRGHSHRLRQATQTTRAAVLTGARWLCRQEAAVLVAALGILLALYSFIKIAEELGKGELAHFDEWLLHLLRVPGHPQSPIGPSWLLEAARDITAADGRSPCGRAILRLAHARCYAGSMSPRPGWGTHPSQSSTSSTPAS